MAAFIPSSNPVFHFTPKHKWLLLKIERRMTFSSYPRIDGTFINNRPVGLFQFKEEDGILIEETVFI